MDRNRLRGLVMTIPNPPVPELTATDYLLADLAHLGETMPSGYHVSLGVRLGNAVAAVEKVFAQHTLPGREEIVAELTLWRTHVDDGLAYAHHVDHLMARVIRQIKGEP
jgi:hypothetical protein